MQIEMQDIIVQEETLLINQLLNELPENIAQLVHQWQLNVLQERILALLWLHLVILDQLVLTVQSVQALLHHALPVITDLKTPQGLINTLDQKGSTEVRQEQQLRVIA
jgi:hypothetical protein